MRRGACDTATGVIVTIGGTGAEGYSGDGGPATEATFNQPYSLQVDSNGDVYVVDRLNYVIRRIDAATGVISTVAGTGEPGYGGDGGPGTEAQFREPNDCFLDGLGGLLVADVQDQRIRRLDLASGIITTFAGNGEKIRGGDGRPATEASILGARAVCTDGAGNTYIAEREGNGIRKVDANGIMSTLAGTGEFGYGGDGSPAFISTWGGPKAIRLRPRRKRAGGGHREPRHPPHRRGHQPRANHRREDGWAARATAARQMRQAWTAPTGATWTQQETSTSPTATTTGCAWWWGRAESVCSKFPLPLGEG